MDWLEKSLFGMLGLLGIGLIGALAFGAYKAVDWLWLPIHVAENAAITDISFRSEHEESRWSAATKTPYVVHVPDKWYLDIHVPEGYDWMTIKHAPWEWQQKGRKVRADYVVSRLSGEVGIRTIYSVTND